jgi:predicted secreted protein
MIARIESEVHGLCLLTGAEKILLIAHCLLNQNAKINRCAHFPGAIQELAHLLGDSGVGLLQMPCPELLYLGLDRPAG